MSVLFPELDDLDNADLDELESATRKPLPEPMPDDEEESASLLWQPTQNTERKKVQFEALRVPKRRFPRLPTSGTPSGFPFVFQASAAHRAAFAQAGLIWGKASSYFFRVAAMAANDLREFASVFQSCKLPVRYAPPWQKFLLRTR